MRDPMEVALEIRSAHLAGWERVPGEGLVRARDREVIAEVKWVVMDDNCFVFESGRDRLLAALDAILEEKP